MGLYRVEAPNDHAVALPGVLRRSGAEIGWALAVLHDLPQVKPHAVELGRLEHEGDESGAGEKR